MKVWFTNYKNDHESKDCLELKKYDKIPTEDYERGHFIEKLADQFWGHRDGWERTWPIDFFIYEDEESVTPIISRTVFMEAVPSFYTEKIQ